MFKTSILFTALLSAAAFASVSAAPVQTEGTGIGKHGEIKLAVTFDNGKIQDIKVLEDHENKVLAAKVFTDLKDAVIANNSVKVDGIAGATFSSKGFLNAVSDAAKKAGVKLSDQAKKAKKADAAMPAVQNYDVVVIGAGGAGFAAAVEAKSKGANVVLIEKMPTVGGNSLISGAEMNVPNSWVQNKLNIKDDTPARMAADTLKGGDFKGDPEIVGVMTVNALPTAEWLRDTVGVNFEKDNVFQFGGHSRKRALIPEGHTGTEVITKFSALADKMGIPVITNMKAEELVKDKDGRVVAVKAVSGDKEYTFNAKGGVVLATGGFGANAQMVKKYNPNIDERFKTTDAPGTTGEALYMAEKAGGQLVNMGYIQTYPICDPISGVIELIADARFDGAILVNQEGKRFVNELETRDNVSAAELAQEGGYAYTILDQKMMDASSTYNSYFTKGYAMQADSYEELAEKLGIDPATFAATMETWNKAVADQKDDEFGRLSFASALDTAPYYAIKVSPGIHHTMGGVKINTNAEVLTEAGEAIPGLYAAGEVTGGVHGANRLGGNAVADIVVFGRIAAQNAAAYIAK